ncbi:MAG: aminoacyl-tRNA hydrolase [Gammaproteobacteria bacterium]|nr:alternative ribosome rescue aminoacyl-tRNA hydrolase ArfB [Gammaproteobacteria bacterium]MXY58565.1 aminoacyl-tRNA hydrolase [Gammaproteobacteria bacterium]MYF28723.1 aminoacyl-tRNA hydrolase [Gammaproteobacteria bacterium]MYK47669.1 aminoacyl-tRNA hydrolase [Gammaproteobacteria bacterium]
MATIEVGGVAIPESAMTWNFVRASGPGGQNVNKVATAAECRLDLEQAGLEQGVRQRLERLAGSRLTGAGEILIVAEKHRTQARNRADALERLGTLIAAARETPKPRVPTRVSSSQKAKRRSDKRHRGEVKRQRKPPDDY